MYNGNNIRLGRDRSYKRPKKTHTDTCQTTEKIEEKLVGYKQCVDIATVKKSTHIRYITWKDGKEVFRTGGYLRSVHDEYVVLYIPRKGSTFSWCVQRKQKKKIGVFEVIFFQKMSRLELCENALKEQHNTITRLEKEKKIMRKKMKQLRSTTR